MPVAPTERLGRARAILGLAASVALLALLAAPPARPDEGQVVAKGEAAGEKPCCHKAPGADDAALPAGLTGDHPPATPGGEATVTLVDASLLDQDGRAIHFPADVVGDRVVVMDFVFTTCTTICPVLSVKLARLQERLGERAGRDVRLISVSIDPARDTPARLKAFAARYKAGPAWIWLTGGVEEVERVLRGLGAYTPRIGDHAPMMLVGDGRTGRFQRLNGLPEVDRLLAAVAERLEARRQVTAGVGAER